MLEAQRTNDGLLALISKKESASSKKSESVSHVIDKSQSGRSPQNRYCDQELEEEQNEGPTQQQQEPLTEKEAAEREANMYKPDFEFAVSCLASGQQPQAHMYAGHTSEELSYRADLLRKQWGLDK